MGLFKHAIFAGEFELPETHVDTVRRIEEWNLPFPRIEAPTAYQARASSPSTQASTPNLVVESTSDFIYLSVLSSHLIDNGREGLNKRWTITPVGGTDLVPMFVALLGHKKLDFTIFVDSRREWHQKLQSLADQGFLAKSRIVTVGQVLGRKLGDIENLFSADDYLSLYNKAFGKKLKASDLSGTDPLVRRITRKEKIDRFDHHGKPTNMLLRHRDDMLSVLSEGALANFEAIFSSINATLQNRC